MKNIYQLLTLICLLVFPLGSFAQKKPAGIAYEAGYTDALAKIAKGRQKKDLVFVYCYIDNSTVCSKMGNLVLKSRKVSDFVNQNFVSAKVNVNQDTAFARRYPMSVLPAFFVLDKDGKEIGRFCGQHEPDAFIEKMMYAMDEKNSVRVKLAAFEKDRTTANGKACMEAYYQAGRVKEMADFVERYLYAYSPEERYSLDMWKYVAPALMNPTSKVFSMFMNEKQLATNGLGKNVVDKVMTNSIRQYLFWFVTGKIPGDPKWNLSSALGFITYLALIDDESMANHYICSACKLYTQKNLQHGKVYKYILDYLTPEKICALEEEDRDFIEKLLENMEGMPKELYNEHKKGCEEYWKKQLEK